MSIQTNSPDPFLLLAYKYNIRILMAHMFTSWRLSPINHCCSCSCSCIGLCLCSRTDFGTTWTCIGTRLDPCLSVYRTIIMTILTYIFPCWGFVNNTKIIHHTKRTSSWRRRCICRTFDLKKAFSAYGLITASSMIDIGGIVLVICI